MAVQFPGGTPRQGWSRRHILRGVAGASAAVGLPRHGRAQAAAQDWRILRAEPGAAGPELRIRRGEELRIRFVNGLSEPSGIEWYGVRTASDSESIPGLRPPLSPGAAADYRFTPRDAGTF